MFKRERRGFTLIELLIVVAIIGILAAIAIPNFMLAQVRAKVARVYSDHRTLDTALNTYLVDNNAFPPDRQFAAYHGGAPSSWFVKALRQLSTPIAYVRRVSNYPDPFNPEKMPVSGETPPHPPSYKYYNSGYGGNDATLSWGNAVASPANGLPTTGCILGCYGPDHFYDGGEWILAFPTQTFRLYDPTNGTTSGGDILRLVGNTRGLMPVRGGGVK